MFEAAAWGLLGASSLLIGAVDRRPTAERGACQARPSRARAGPRLRRGDPDQRRRLRADRGGLRLGGADAVASGSQRARSPTSPGPSPSAAAAEASGCTPVGRTDADSSSALLLGAVLDGIPESAVIGITLLEGGSDRRPDPRRRLHLEPPGGDLIVPRDAQAGRSARRTCSGRGRLVCLVSAISRGAWLRPARGRLRQRGRLHPGLRRRRGADDARRHDVPRAAYELEANGRHAAGSGCAVGLAHRPRLRARLSAQFDGSYACS